MQGRRPQKIGGKKIDTNELYAELTRIVSKFVSESRAIGMTNAQQQKEDDVIQKLDDVRKALNELKNDEEKYYKSLKYSEEEHEDDKKREEIGKRMPVPDSRNKVLKAIAELYKTMVAMGYEEKLSAEARAFPSSRNTRTSFLSMFGFDSPNNTPLTFIVEKYFPELKNSEAKTLDQKIMDSFSPPSVPPPFKKP